MILTRLANSPPVKRALQAIFIFGCFFFLSRQLAGSWSAAGALLNSLNWKYLAWSFFWLAVSFFLRPAAIYFLALDSSQQVSYLASGRSYFISQLAKYLPGGVWVYPSRLVLLNQAGMSAGFASLGLAYESVVMVLASLLVGLGAAYSLPDIPYINRALLLLMLVGFTLATVALLLSPEIARRFFPRLLARWQWLEWLGGLPVRTRLGNFLLVTGVYASMWVLTGLSFHYILRAVLPAGSPPAFLAVSLSVFAFAWALGFLSIFNPGGLGLREAALALMLAPFVPAPAPVLAALLSRLSWSLAEVLFFGLSWLRLPGEPAASRTKGPAVPPQQEPPVG